MLKMIQESKSAANDVRDECQSELDLHEITIALVDKNLLVECIPGQQIRQFVKDKQIFKKIMAVHGIYELFIKDVANPYDEIVDMLQFVSTQHGQAEGVAFEILFHLDDIKFFDHKPTSQQVLEIIEFIKFDLIEGIIINKALNIRNIKTKKQLQPILFKILLQNEDDLSFSKKMSRYLILNSDKQCFGDASFHQLCEQFFKFDLSNAQIDLIGVLKQTLNVENAKKNKLDYLLKQIVPGESDPKKIIEKLQYFDLTYK